ncbi:MAG TPA: MgtC/SapB family protein [Terriglobales bacterium]|nr:MgtC/SapB family protein [Terriglobales bacterium]
MQLLSSNLLRLLLAALLGGAIGLERELSRKPAGLRTNMFICFGSAMFTILSDLMVDPQLGDHTRIAANIITGIGFIGAGSILHERGSVQGLTTAATIFVVAAIGMAAGGGFMLLAIFATVIILLALRLLGLLETRFNFKPLHMAYEAAGEKADQIVAEINSILEADHKIMESIEVAPTTAGFLVHFTICATYREHQALLDALKRSKILSAITFIGSRE